MSETIEIGRRTYEPPFSIEDAGVTTDIVDAKGHLLMGWHGKRKELGNLITAALNDYRPWRYPSRGEFAETGKWYLVTTDSGEVVMAEAEDGLKWWDENEYPLHIRAWRELPEPAPALEDK